MKMFKKKVIFLIWMKKIQIKKKIKPKTTVIKNINNKNSSSKKKADLFNFEEEPIEDIFSKKDGVSSIFDTDDNDKEKKDNAVSSIFD